MSSRKEQYLKDQYCNADAEKRKRSLFLLKRENATRVAAEKTRMYGTQLLTHSQQMVNQLKNTKESVLTDINNATSKSNIEEYQLKRKMILRLLEEMQINKYKISRLTSEMQESKVQCDKISRQLILKELEIKSVFGQRKTEAQFEKRIESLENRLYFITTRTNLRFCRMNSLREEIRNLLIYRGICHGKYVFFRKELKKDFKKLRKVMHKTKHNFIAREDLMLKTKSIREHEVRDIVHFRTDLTELSRVYAEEDEYENFIITKNRQRQILENEFLRKVRIETTREANLDQNIKDIEKSFKKLYAITDTEDVKAMVHFYKDQEERNRSEVLNVSQTNDDLEAVHKSVAEIKWKIENNVRIQENEEFDLLVELKNAEAEFTEMTHKIEVVEGALRDQEKENDYFVFRMRKLFGICKCSTKVFKTRLDVFTSIQMKNMPTCIQALENHFMYVKKQLRIYNVRRQRRETGVRHLRNYRRFQLPTRKLKSQGGPFIPELTFAKVDLDDESSIGSENTFHKDEKIHPLNYYDAKAEVLDEIQAKGKQAMGLSNLPEFHFQNHSQ